MAKGEYEHYSGIDSPHFKHGQSQSRLYRIWANMKTRCTNPNSTRFKDWGARGITVCEEWRNDFQAFYDWAMSNGYSDDLTIDRIDNGKGYCPENCRWATYSEQNLNKKSVPTYEYHELVFHQSETEHLFGIKRTTFQRRIKCGWTVEQAIETGVRHGK